MGPLQNRRRHRRSEGTSTSRNLGAAKKSSQKHSFSALSFKGMLQRKGQWFPWGVVLGWHICCVVIMTESPLSGSKFYLIGMNDVLSAPQGHSPCIKSSGTWSWKLEREIDKELEEKTRENRICPVAFHWTWNRSLLSLEWPQTESWRLCKEGGIMSLSRWAQ